MRTLLLTGHSGFAGRIVRSVIAADPHAHHWEIAVLPAELDIRSPDLAGEIVRLRPQAVVHLAARASVAESFRDPQGYFDVNVHGTWNLLRALHSTGFGGRFLYVGSGDCYGRVDEDSLPIAESTPLRPRSPYAVSKVAAEALCYQWSQGGSFEIVLARPFNQIGPGQDARFVVAAFAEQVARIRAGKAPPTMRVGNLDVTRDLSDVRDVARAYLRLVDAGRNGAVYNVASGRETCIRDVLETLLELAGVRAEITVDPARLRADEQRRAVADVKQIELDTGWRATTPLAASLTAVLDDWNRRIQDE